LVHGALGAPGGDRSPLPGRGADLDARGLLLSEAAELELLRPASLSEASAMLVERGDSALALGGGTALVLLLRQRLIAPRYLVGLTSLPGLRDIVWDDIAGARIGGLATLREVERSATLRRALPLVPKTYATVGNVRVRHAATVGGNLAHGDYRLDPPAALLALHGVARIVGPGGTREGPLGEVFLGLYATALEPGAILTEVVVPDPPPRTHTAHLEYPPLSAMDWPCLGVAAAVTLAADGTCDDLRVVLTSVSSTPVLVQGAAERVRGQRLTAALLDAVGAAAAAQVEPTPDIR